MRARPWPSSRTTRRHSSTWPRRRRRRARLDLAIASYEEYRALKPNDPDALQTLAALYGTQIAEAQRRATIASNEAAEASLPNTFAPEDSEFLQDLTTNPLTDSLSAQAEARASAANAEVQSLAAAQLGIFSELVELVDDNPLLFLQWAQAAETAQDFESAITAYEGFLDAPTERGQRRAGPGAHRLPEGDHGRLTQEASRARRAAAPGTTRAVRVRTRPLQKGRARELRHQRRAG